MQNSATKKVVLGALGKMINDSKAKAIQTLQKKELKMCKKTRKKIIILAKSLGKSNF